MAETNFDVVVVGSGISGLACARFIHRECPTIKIIVLEARDRVGGRILYENSADVGGGWIGPTQKHCLSAAAELGLELVVQTWPSVVTAGDKGSDGNLKRVEELCECCGYAEPPLPPDAKQDLEHFIGYLDGLAVDLRRVYGGEPWKIAAATSSPQLTQADNLSLLDAIRERIRHPDAQRAMAMICQTVLAAEPRDVSVPSCCIPNANSEIYVAKGESTRLPRLPRRRRRHRRGRRRSKRSPGIPTNPLVHSPSPSPLPSSR
jgi:phytoene dehydrogenase-like protein